MRINHNISSMISQSTNYRVNQDLNKSLEKLSTGLRINRAADDAAGLSISEELRTRVQGGTVAERNIGDAISLLRIADGALDEVDSCLQRMRELAVQGANDTLTHTERSYLEREYEALRNEIGRVITATQFNGITLFEKNTGVTGVAANAEGRYGNADAEIGATDRVGFNPLDGIGNISAEEGEDGGDESGGRVLTFQIGPDGAYTPGSASTYDLYDSSNMLNIALPDMSLTAIFLQNGFDPANHRREDAEQFDHRLADEDAENMAWAMDGLTAVYQTGGPAEELLFTASESCLNTIAIIDGGGRGSDLESNAESHVAGLRRVNSVRAYLGSVINRLEHSLENLKNQNHNQAMAESQIRDTDFASETAQFTRSRILSQASTAMLAQANSTPKIVAQLVR